MFLVNLDCFHTWKVETNVRQAYFFFTFFSLIIFVVTPLQSVFFIFQDEYPFGSGSKLYATTYFVLLNPLVL